MPGKIVYTDFTKERNRVNNNPGYPRYKGLEDAVVVLIDLYNTVWPPNSSADGTRRRAADILYNAKLHVIDQIKTYPWVHQMIERTICSKN